MALTVFKLTVGYVSGSVGVISEGIHSFLDLVSAAVAFFTIREAGKPADHGHPYGHGKIETLSSLFESLLLVVASALIVYEGVDHVLHPREVRYQGLAIATIAISMIVSWLMYRHNRDAGWATDSSAIQVNALHFLSDVVASAGVLAGLILMSVTGWTIVDPILAFTVAGYILLISLKQVRTAIQELTDTRLPDAEVATIRGVLDEFRERVIETHELRTRKSGATRHVDFHLVVCGQLTVNESHAMCDELEGRITGVFPAASVNIHVEPCLHENTRCKESCDYYKRRRGQ